MIDMRYKPYYLPQINCPYSIVMEKLNEQGIDCEVIKVEPNELKPLQGIVFSGDINFVELNDLNPIWVDMDNNILDGHHRWVKALSENTPIIAVKIYMNNKDGCRLLNKIQDIYEYEQAISIEETGSHQNNINMENSIDSDGSRSDFLSTLEESNETVVDEKSEKNAKKIFAYRKDPIRENSVVGNFFLLSPVNGFGKYEIEFDNLLDTNDMGLTYVNNQQPVDILARIWFPNINFEKLSETYKITSENLKNRAVAEKAMKLGYDGIKYGDTLLQGLK